MKQNQFTVELSDHESVVIQEALGRVASTAARMVDSSEDGSMEEAAAASLLAQTRAWETGFHRPTEKENAFVQRLRDLGRPCAAYPDGDKVRLYLLRGLDCQNESELVALTWSLRHEVSEAFINLDSLDSSKAPLLFDTHLLFEDNYSLIETVAAQGLSETDENCIRRCGMEGGLEGDRLEDAVHNARDHLVAYCRERVVHAVCDRVLKVWKECERVQDADRRSTIWNLHVRVNLSTGEVVDIAPHTR